MTLRRGHGTGAAAPLRIEVAPADEQRPGIPAPPAEPTRPVPRLRDGRFTPEGARLAGAAGGRKAAKRRIEAQRFAAALRLAPAMPPFEPSTLARPFVEEAERWLQAKIAELAANVGGGEVGAGVVSILRTAAWQTYTSRMLFELGTGRALLIQRDAKGEGSGLNLGILAQAARLGDAARQNLLAAHELARLEAEARAARADAADDAPWVTKGESGGRSA